MKAKVNTPEKPQGSPFRSRGRDPFGVQAKLFVNKPGDKHEAEADHAAESVVRGSSPASAPAAGNPSPVQLKPIAQTVTPYIQRKEGADQMGQLDIEGTEDKMGTVDHEGQIQRKEDESAQLKEEESVQLKEEEAVQKKEDDEPVQKMEEGGGETESAEAEEPDVEEPETEEAPDEGGDKGVQMKEEDASAQLKEDDEPAQMKEDDDAVQTKRFDKAPAAPSTDIGTQLKNTKGQGSPLSSDVKTEMETGFGADFSNVKIHTGTSAVDMNKSLGAKAFTNKGDIYFNQGKFDPSSQEGKFLLAHELTHTIQQGAATPKADLKQPAPETAAEDKKEKEAVAAIEEPALKVGKDAAKEAAPDVKEAPKVDPKAAKKGKKDANGKAVEEPVAEGGEEAKEEKKKSDPKSDPNFMEVMQNVAVTADKQAEHQPAGELSEDAQEAAPSPENERESIAQADQVEEMEEAEPKPFNAKAFKDKLMERIASMKLPENQDEADNFEENNNIDEVNKDAVGDVAAEKDTAVGPVEATSQAAPKTDQVPKRETTPLTPLQKGKKPGDVGAAKAVPPTRGEEEVSQPLKEQTAEVDQKMAENEVTDEQLEKSEEPKFVEALDSKKDAKAKSEEAPKNFRKDEENVRQTHSSKSEEASQEQLAGMHALRGGAFMKVMGNQKAAGKKDTTERERIANDINAIYETTKTEVEGILDTLEDRVATMFEGVAEDAKAAFEKFIELKMAWYKAERYSGIGGGLRWTKDLFVGMPDEVNEFFVEGKEVFAKVMEKGIDEIAVIVADELNRAQQRIKKGKADVTAYVESLPKNLRHLGKEAASEIQDKFSALYDDVNSREEALIDTLAQEYIAAEEEVNERIEEMKAANRGLIDAVMGFINGVIETILKLKEMITNLFAAIKSVIGVIIADPIGFMGNLFDGIGQGIDLFKANIQQHLLGGLIEWLTGSLGPMGITMPKDIFSLSGIFNLVLQVLGLGWDYIRLKAVKMMGEPVVKALEGGFDMFKVFATKGIDGIWEFLKDQFNDLKETVIDSIKEMLITQVIQAGIKWLLSLLIPGAGFIKAIMAIKDLIVFFVESAMMLIPALTEAILALAAGSVAGVAKAIEFGLAKLIGLVINLFAKLIGLGGLSKKVTAIFKKIRKRVDKALNKLLKKARKAGRKLMRKLGIGKKKSGGKDDRSKKEMEADLRMGIKEGTTYVKSAEGKDKKEIDKKLKKIAGKYDLKKLELIIDKHNDNGKEQVHVHGEVNPEFNGEKIVIEMEEGKVSLPPKGYAYFLREYKHGRHFKVILSTGSMIDLEDANGTVNIRVNSKTFQNAANSEAKNPPKVVTIETPGEGKKENFIALKVDESKTSKTQIEKAVEDFNGRPYAYGDAYDEKHLGKKLKKQPIDCFKFAVDLLNGIIEKKNKQLTPVGEDNDERFDNLLPESDAILKNKDS